MRVQVKGYLGLQAALGDQESIVLDEGTATLRDLVEHLEAVFGIGAAPTVAHSGILGPQRRFLVLLNGRHVAHLADGPDTLLKDGDQIAVFPPAVGG